MKRELPAEVRAKIEQAFPDKRRRAVAMKALDALPEGSTFLEFLRAWRTAYEVKSQTDSSKDDAYPCVWMVRVGHLYLARDSVRFVASPLRHGLVILVASLADAVMTPCLWEARVEVRNLRRVGLPAKVVRRKLTVVGDNWHIVTNRHCGPLVYGSTRSPIGFAGVTLDSDCYKIKR